MGISNCNPSEQVQIDGTYPSRIQYRKELMEKYPTVTYGWRPEIVKGIEELYEYLIGWYLPKRWPGLFRIVKKKKKAKAGEGLGEGPGVLEEDWFENMVTGDEHPIIPPTRQVVVRSGSEWITAVDYLLRAIGTTIEEDILILLTDKDAAALLPEGENLLYLDANDPDFKLRAFVACFPAGFNPAGSLGKRLGHIHGPVPGYKERLQMSVDRFFHRIVVGKPWRRWNWAITMNSELWTPHGHEIYEKLRKENPVKEDFDPAQVR